ncbi:leucyl aminopeptidase [Rubricella aquisinus]|uniref:Probable cytosol aminopeptidase n=1 Tax=Rubricella aquisinus TaxID=2028108 RepID=A0A840WII1_9RHOB|nr:leucyl aminopeptidase [Rubricella aquisinus]MBB5514928.1 leucyl aminopeptidase [Rubricella aquisinus]
MTDPVQISFHEPDLDAIATTPGQIAVILGPDGSMDRLARRVNRLTRGALVRLSESEGWEKMAIGSTKTLAFPQGVAAESVIVLKLEKRSDALVARKAGAALAKAMDGTALLICAGAHPRAHELAYGLALRSYSFDAYRTAEDDVSPTRKVSVMVSRPEVVSAKTTDQAAAVEGVFFARDLVSEPANVLTTSDFAARLAAMQELGLEVEILEEEELEKLGMRTLLAVGEGSESPSKVVVMRWNGGGDEAPLALVGKGVVFDTGGISIKPAGGMEEMTMDMGGAAVVSGVMRTIALRKAKANVVGLVGLVENMPDGRAQRPGDVVKSMKGDTVEVINTDAEGRLVLADVLWYAQERFNPSGVIDLATLTGAIIIALGHENAGVFSNDDDFAKTLLKAAEAEGEGAWRMPMGPAYDRKLKSRIADIANVGGRDGGSITAAQFLQRFIKDGTPWAHIDIAGVAYVKGETDFSPKGATGWGVRALDRLIADAYEPSEG